MYLAGPGLSGVNLVNIMAVWVPIAIEVTLKDMGKIGQYQPTTKHNDMRTMCICLGMYRSVKNEGKYLQVRPLSFMVISDVYTSYIPNKTTFTEYCITQWISELHGSFEIHWVKQYLVNFTGLLGIVNANVYMTERILTGLWHG